MKTEIIVRTKSGGEYQHELTPEGAAMDPEAACEEFFDKMDFSNLTALRLGTRIYFPKEIEMISFVAVDDTPLPL